MGDSTKESPKGYRLSVLANRAQEFASRQPPQAAPTTLTRDQPDSTSGTPIPDRLSSSEPIVFQFDEDFPETAPESLSSYAGASGLSIPSVGAYARLVHEARSLSGDSVGQSRASTEAGGITLPAEQPLQTARPTQTTDIQIVVELLRRIAGSMERLVEVVEARDDKNVERTQGSSEEAET